MPPKRNPTWTKKQCTTIKLNRGIEGLRKRNIVKKLILDTPSTQLQPQPEDTKPEPEDTKPEPEDTDILSYEYLRSNEDTSWVLIR